MRWTNRHATHKLAPGRALSLQDAFGRDVTCVEGCIWLTMQGDSRDVVVMRGETFAIDRNGLTVVVAPDATVIQVTARRAPGRLHDTILEFLRGAGIGMRPSVTHAMTADVLIHKKRRRRYYLSAAADSVPSLNAPANRRTFARRVFRAWSKRATY